jgi:hypothetical protein
MHEDQLFGQLNFILGAILQLKLQPQLMELQQILLKQQAEAQGNGREFLFGS